MLKLWLSKVRSKNLTKIKELDIRSIQARKQLELANFVNLSMMTIDKQAQLKSQVNKLSHRLS